MIFMCYMVLLLLVSGLGIFTISNFFGQAFDDGKEIDNFNALFLFGVAVILAVIVIVCLYFIGLELYHL